MPVCCIIQCGAKKNKNQPQLTLHRFPKKESLRLKWLEAIGIENINPRHKNWYVCSLHFEESSFNRTLDVIRLHDNAVPSSFLQCKISSAPFEKQSSLSESNIQERFIGDATTIFPTCSVGSDSTTSAVCEAQISQKCDKNKKKTCEELRKKIKVLNEAIRRRNKKIANLNNIIEDLKNNRSISMEESQLLEECAGPQDFLKRQLNKTKGLPLEKKYSEEIRKFSLTLHFLSPKAYDFVRETYNTCLPHPRTLCKWYQSVHTEPGFTQEAFNTLKMKVEQSDHPLICALILDEMAIRKGLIWDPRNQKYQGRVDYGHNIDSDSVDEANQAFVYMLNCINGSWKLPIGYFLITAISGEQKSVLTRMAIYMCQEVGVKVVSVTCDGPAANFSMFACLGSDLLKNQENNQFICHDSIIHPFIDPCHALKLIRNAFGELRLFKDFQGRDINFKYLELLLNLQEKQGLHLANRLTKSHIFFQKQKMKVRLATQLFSNSVADALEYCQSNLKLVEFRDCSGTVNFINIINNIFDVLNSHSIRPPGLKKAMCHDNIGLIRELFNSASDYLKTLKLPSGELLISSRRKTGFISILNNMNSALSLFNHVVHEMQVLKYLPMYKISQDHLELFFSSIRARGGLNNNPNAIQFRAAYKKILIRAEIRDGGVGNCIPLDQINILTCTSKNPIKNINDLSDRQNIVEIAEDENDLFEMYSDLITVNLDQYTESVLEYIAGFVSKKLCRLIRCDTCLSLLLGVEKINSLIALKSRGGLTHASFAVVDIIKKTEKIIKPHLLSQSKSKPEQYYLHIFKYMYEYYNTEKLFFLKDHQEHNNNHRLLLIKSVIKTYADIRFRHYGNKHNEKVSFRNYLNKIILFRNE